MLGFVDGPKVSPGATCRQLDDIGSAHRSSSHCVLLVHPTDMSRLRYITRKTLNVCRELGKNARRRGTTNRNYFLRWLSAYSSGRFFFIQARIGQNTTHNTG